MEDDHAPQSIDGKARWVDNVIVERWLGSLKSEYIKIEGSTNQSALIVLSVIDLEMLYCCYRDVEKSAGKSFWVSQTRIG